MADDKNFPTDRADRNGSRQDHQIVLPSDLLSVDFLFSEQDFSRKDAKCQGREEHFLKDLDRLISLRSLRFASLRDVFLLWVVASPL
jgi:hypothetical protein